MAAACRDAGVELVATPHEMTVVLAALNGGRRTGSGRTAVCTDGGGHGAVAADAAESAGLAVPELGAAAQEQLATLLWEQSAVRNPVDLAGMGEQNPHSYGDTVGALLALDEVDAVLLTGYFGGYSAATGGLGGPLAESGTAGGGSALAAGELETAHQMAGHAARHAQPLVVQSMFPHAPSCRTLAEAGIPVFAAAEDAARALAAMSVRGAAGPPGVHPLPPAAPPLRDTGYHGIRALLTAAGVPYPEAREITDEAQLRAATEAFPGPYVLKALHLLHKSDAGAVALRLPDRDALVTAHRERHARLGAASYSVERWPIRRTGWN